MRRSCSVAASRAASSGHSGWWPAVRSRHDDGDQASGVGAGGVTPKRVTQVATGYGGLSMPKWSSWRASLFVVLALVAALFSAPPARAGAGATTFYFAEGTTRPDFAETLYFLNPGPSGIVVDVEYNFADAAPPVFRQYIVPGRATVAIVPSAEVTA